MLESLNSNTLEYQKLTKEEMAKRGILGRLIGICADFIDPTRNGRRYSEDLWEKTFADPIMQERINNGVCFGELGHPTDREETDMEKIAVCLPEIPKKGKDGKLRAVFDILATPNGKILKTLCDYGSTLGVSSRGSGEVFTDYDGRESVDPDSYICQGFDIVLIPAVKEARLQYVSESLDNKKSLRESLQETVDNANEEEKKVMKETLSSLGVSLNEDDLHPQFRKDVKDQYKSFSNSLNKYEEKEKEIEKVFKELNPNATPEEMAKTKDFVLGEKPVFKYRKGYDRLERQNYPYYVVNYEGTSYYHPEEGGYYQAGLEPTYSEGYNSFEEAQNALANYVEDNDTADITFSPSNVPRDSDEYSYEESTVNLKPIFDRKKGIIGAKASGKYVGQEKQIWIEPNKDYLKRTVGYQMYESYTKAVSPEEVEDALNYYKENAFGFDGLKDFVETDYSHWSKERREEIFRLLKKKLTENLSDSNVNDESLYIKEVNESKAVENNEALVEELQNTLKSKKKLEDRLIEMQEKLSVSYAKEAKLVEDVQNLRTSISKLTDDLQKTKALSEKQNQLNETLTLKANKVQALETSTDTLKKQNNEFKRTATTLKESLQKKDLEINRLQEDLSNVKKDYENKIYNLNESIATLEKDLSQKKANYINKLNNSNQLVEKYKIITNKAVDRYISSQARLLGVSNDEIKNRLPKNYSFDDIDSICENLQEYKISLSKLPFNVSNENIRIRATESKNDYIKPAEKFDDIVDEGLKNLAGI